VRSVGDQGQRSSAYPKTNSCDNDSGIENDPDRKRKAEAVGCVSVPDVAVSMGMVVIDGPMVPRKFFEGCFGQSKQYHPMGHEYYCGRRRKTSDKGYR